MSFSVPDAYTFTFRKIATNSTFVISIAPYGLAGSIGSVALIGMPLPERIQLKSWYIFPSGAFDPGLTSDVVMSITRDEVVEGATTQTFVEPDADDRIVNVSALTFLKGETLGIRLETTTGGAGDFNDYNFVISGVFVRSD